MIYPPAIAPVIKFLFGSDILRLTSSLLKNSFRINTLYFNYGLKIIYKELYGIEPINGDITPLNKPLIYNYVLD